MKVFRNSNGFLYYIVKNGRSSIISKAPDDFKWVAYPYKTNNEAPKIVIGDDLVLDDFILEFEDRLSGKEKGACWNQYHMMSLETSIRK